MMILRIDSDKIIVIQKKTNNIFTYLLLQQMAKKYTWVSFTKAEKEEWGKYLSFWKAGDKAPDNLMFQSAEFEFNTDNLKPWGKYRISIWKWDKAGARDPKGSISLSLVEDDAEESSSSQDKIWNIIINEEDFSW